MTTPMPADPRSEKLMELARRCEEATADETASLLIDAFDLTNWRSRHSGRMVTHNPEWWAFDRLIRAGGLLDAATTFVPSNTDFGINREDGGGVAHIDFGEQFSAATPALALCAAALRALASQEPRNG